MQCLCHKCERIKPNSQQNMCRILQWIAGKIKHTEDTKQRKKKGMKLNIKCTLFNNSVVYISGMNYWLVIWIINTWHVLCRSLSTCKYYVMEHCLKWKSVQVPSHFVISGFYCSFHLSVECWMCSLELNVLHFYNLVVIQYGRCYIILF